MQVFEGTDLQTAFEEASEHARQYGGTVYRGRGSGGTIPKGNGGLTIKTTNFIYRYVVIP